MNFIDVGDPTASAGLNTPLSRSFAAQGIKIPIRKEGKADKNEDDED